MPPQKVKENGLRCAQPFFWRASPASGGALNPRRLPRAPSGFPTIAHDDVARVSHQVDQLDPNCAPSFSSAKGPVFPQELAKRSTGKTLYILDEPTTGLHFEDIRKLLEVLQDLVNKGNTVLVIEHNLDVIKSADYILDLGPEGGDGGGLIIAEGTPEDIAATKGSFTGAYLKTMLDARQKTA